MIDLPSPPEGARASMRGINVTYILMGATDATILPFLPLYLYERGFSAALIGLVLALMALAMFAASPAWAYLADRRLGSERAVVVSGFTTAALAMALPAMTSAGALAVTMVVIFTARAPLMSLLDAIALQKLGAGGQAGYARIRLRMSAGWAASVVVAGLLFQVAGLWLIPYIYAPMTLLLSLWMWRSLARNASASRPKPGTAPAGKLRLGSLPLALVGFLVSGLLLGSAFAGASNFVTLRISVLGGGALLIGAAAAFQALTEIPTMAYTHVLMRYLSHRRLYVAGAGVYLLVFVAWALVSDAFATALLKLVMGVGFALTYVAAVLIADDVAPAHLRATVQALVKAVLGSLAAVLGPLAAGVIYGGIGPAAMFLAAAAVAAIAAVVALIAVPERRPCRGTAADLEAAPATHL